MIGMIVCSILITISLNISNPEKNDVDPNCNNTENENCNNEGDSEVTTDGHGIFAIISTLCGIFILWIAPDYNPEVKDRSSFLVDRVMVWAMSYFVYDFFAMYHVYIARKETLDDNAKRANINQENSNLSQTSHSQKSLDAKHDSNELRNNSISDHNSSNGDTSILSSVNKNKMNSNCDKDQRSIGEQISWVSSNGTSHKNARYD